MGESVVDDAVLVVTELVTNAVLHGSAPISVEVSWTGGPVRLEVGDASPIPPALRSYGSLALTGRGLKVVNATATTWGIAAEGGGKVVWAEVHGSDEAPREGSGAANGANSVAAPTEDTMIRYLGVPVRTYLHMQERNDAITRECALLKASATRDVPDRLLELAQALADRLSLFREPHRDRVKKAAEEGAEVVDLAAEYSLGVVTRTYEFTALMTELDGFGRSGILASGPPDADVAMIREFFLDQAQSQFLDGAAPVPFPVFRAARLGGSQQ
jgi:hypothetical protein